MSAFIVSQEHINALVAVAIYGPKDAEGQWHGPSWSRECEPYEAVPGYPQSITNLRWMKVCTGGLEQLRKQGEVTANELGDILAGECVRSVSHRYPDDAMDELPGTYPAYWLAPFQYNRHGFGIQPTTVQALKLLDCYEYQSCEHPGWKESEAHDFCQSMRSNLIGCLPGYSAAPWEWDKERIAA